MHNELYSLLMVPLSKSDLKKLDMTIGSLAAYLRASKTMYKRLLKGQIHYSPIANVLISLSLEKSLKALIYFLDQTSIPHVHDLEKLSDQLSDKSRGYLILLSGIKYSHFPRLMRQYKAAFIQWRYVIEDGSNLFVDCNAMEDAMLLIDGSLFILRRLKKDQPIIKKVFQKNKNQA